MDMDRNEVNEELKNIEHKRVQVFILNNRGETSIYTVKAVVKFNGESLKILDRAGTEVMVMYQNIEKITKRDMVDGYGRIDRGN